MEPHVAMAHHQLYSVINKSVATPLPSYVSRRPAMTHGTSRINNFPVRLKATVSFIRTITKLEQVGFPFRFNCLIASLALLKQWEISTTVIG